MIVDTSAVVAIMRGEEEAHYFSKILNASTVNQMAAPNFLELCMVLASGKNQKGTAEIDALLDSLGVEIIAFTPEMAKTATQAFLVYGKGTGHPAQLNFGDCMAYAASKVEGLPLLFKGNDFRATDVACAI